MWLMSYITNNSIRKPGAVQGSVITGGQGTSIIESAEHKKLEQCLPYGIMSTPPNGKNAVALPLGDGEVSLGVTDNEFNTEPGELALFSQGGAYIILKNNGNVVINGRVFEHE